MKTKDKLLKIYRADKIYLAEWILAIVTGMFVFITSSTWDLQSLTIWSTNVLDVIYEGKFRDLYEYTANNIYGVHHAHMGSELMSVLPWSIWNLPIWIIQRFFDRPIIDSALLLAYSKLFMVLLTVITVIYTKKVTYLITGDKFKSTLAMYLTASSTYIYLSVCYSGQNDIMMICSSVIAVYYLLQNKRKTFLAWSALSIAIKPFFILPFLAVLLLSEKNLLKILLKSVVAVSGLVVQKLIFNGAPGYEESMNSGPAKQMMENMFPSNINTNFGGISFFAISLVLIYLYTYTRDFKNDDYGDKNSNIGKYAVYIIAVTYTCYVMFSPFSFYRLATLTPFIYIVLVQNKDMLPYNSLFDVAMQFCLLMKLVLRGSKLFRVDYLNKAVVQRWFGYSVNYNAHSCYSSIDNYLFEKNDLYDKLQAMFAGVAAVSAVMLLVLNHPEEKIKLKVSGDVNCRALMWIRTLIIVPFALLSVYMFAMAVIKNFP